MADVIKTVIVFVLSNYSFMFLVIGLLFSIAAIAWSKKPIGLPGVIDKLLSWHVFWVIGVGYFYNFVMHAFFGQMSAAFIGWADSPFQFEVATASLGFAVVGFLAAFRSFDLRLAAIVGPGLFMLGAAAGHVYQMMTEHNFAPGNAGLILYMDIIIPLFGLLLNLPSAGLRVALATSFAALSIWLLWLWRDRRGFLVFFGLFLGVVAWWLSISPSHDRPWRPEGSSFARLSCLKCRNLLSAFAPPRPKVSA